MTAAANSLKQDFSDCGENLERWADPYGQCYRKIGEFIEKELQNEKDWCVTVGEINSHFNFGCGDYFQFNYGDLHFNIIRHKL